MFSGQFLSLALNPAVALACAALMGYLARLLPQRGHLLLLCVAFVYLALGFISQDMHGFSQVGGINYAGNMLFFSAIAMATASTMVRVGIAVPLLAYGIITLAALSGFVWFVIVQPSLLGRIVVVSISFSAMCLVALARLAAVGMRSGADRLMIAGLAMALLMTIGRPVLAVSGLLSVNAGGNFDQSPYWDSIRTVTPLVTVVITALFVTAITLDTIDNLRTQANRDYLTGLLNRRGFELEARMMLAKASAEQQPALLMADIDNFKSINDTFGHEAGDKVLMDVGRLLAAEGGTPLAGRTGGEEFALFYAGITLEGLQRAARGIQARLQASTISGLPSHQRVTVSIGLHMREGNEDLGAMMRRADMALYDAKREGKDRVVLARQLRSV